MHRTVRVVAGLITLALVGSVLTSRVTARTRAQAQADWFQGKHLTLAPVVKGLNEPTYVAGVPDGSRRLIILERDGRVRIADADGQLRPTPLLDLTQAVSSSGNEQGLLGLAFDPTFDSNAYLYLSYTAKDRSVQIVRYAFARDGPDQIDPSSAQTVLAVPKQSTYHNGGMLAFGPDRYLYIGVGDDEESDSAQDLGTIFGKILRLDVASGQPYAIPASNPFAQQAGARGEVWAYGLRNPWRFSFDRATGDLWIADVGDATWEEIDFQPASSAGGENYGWPIYEGAQCERLAHCHDAGLVAPVATYDHNMNCAVIGGYVYRATDATGLFGHYLYGDLCTGGVFTLRSASDPAKARVELGYQPIKIDSFGEDPNGSVYVSDFQGGVVYRIVDGSVPQ